MQDHISPVGQTGADADTLFSSRKAAMRSTGWAADGYQSAESTSASPRFRSVPRARLPSLDGPADGRADDPAPRSGGAVPRLVHRQDRAGEVFPDLGFPAIPYRSRRRGLR